MRKGLNKVAKFGVRQSWHTGYIAIVIRTIAGRSWLLFIPIQHDANTKRTSKYKWQPQKLTQTNKNRNNPGENTKTRLYLHRRKGYENASGQNRVKEWKYVMRIKANWYKDKIKEIYND